MDQARPYQIQAMELIREKFAEGNKSVVLWLATGAGKTFIFCRMVKSAIERKQKAIIVVRGRKLVDQASKRLFREQVPHGVLMAGHWNYRPDLPVQVCSIDTLIARELTPEADLIIIDEAHLFSKKSKASKFLENYPDAFKVPVTATPYLTEGMKHLAQAIVHPITMNELIEQKHLVGFRVFAPPGPDLSSIKVSASTKDYMVDELAEVMETDTLTGKIIDHWLLLAERKPTIAFCVNIHHSKLLVQKFRNAGIRAEHCDADTPDVEREEIIERLINGETEVVCNVGILCTGVDIPPLWCIIMARPTKSYNLFVQQAGRGTRPYKGKTQCLLLDHAGNCYEHGLPTDEPDVNLDGERVRAVSDKKSKICKQCFAVFRASKCPECGVEAPEIEAEEVSESDKKLKELTPEDFHKITVLREFKKLQKQAKESGKKPQWAMHKIVQKFGADSCRHFLSEWFLNKHYSRDSIQSHFKSAAIVPKIFG